MIIEISIALIAVAFVALVIAIIVAIKALRRTLLQVNKTLIEVREQLEQVGDNAAKTIEHTNQISYDLKRKMESLDPMFNAFSNIGDFLEHKTFSLKRGLAKSDREEKRVSHIDEIETESQAAEEESIKATDVFDFVDTGLRLWQKIKKRSKQ